MSALDETAVTLGTYTKENPGQGWRVYDADMVDARIAELEAENERLLKWDAVWRGRVDKAEADLDAWLAKYNAVREENERLHVCGTCGQSFDNCGLMQCDEDETPQPVFRFESCHFDPPRWTPYWEDE